MELFDSHAHLDDEKFDKDREELIKRIHQKGVKKLVTVGYSVESSGKAVNIANKYDYIYCTVGISPNDIEDEKEKIERQIQEIEKLIQGKKVVAVGEIGLDYYWNKQNKELQQFAFKEQIKLANKYELPIVIHARDCVHDILQILKNESCPIKKGIFHCCPLNKELVKQGLGLGFYISLAGPITFKNSKNADEIINMIPNDRILIETDSPYLSPEPKRGTRNDPGNVIFNAKKIADAKEMMLEEIAKITYENAIQAFQMKLL